VNNITRLFSRFVQRWKLSLFEKVILVNTFVLLLETVVALWITSHNLERNHYLIDMTFIVVSTLATLVITIVLLRLSFRPLFGLLTTIREVSLGKTDARASIRSSDTEIDELAGAFNGMLDTLETVRRERSYLILQAQEDERRRIALELHDEAGQNLTALLIHTELLQQHLQEPLTPETRAQLADGLQQLTRLAEHTLENIRVLSQQLRPSVLDDLGLIPAFRWLVEDSRRSLQLSVQLSIRGFDDREIRPLPPLYETTLFRIAQECLTNIARHAGTTEASVELWRTAEQVCVRVIDRGCGYDPSTQRTSSGIVGMRERATLLKGTLTIRSAPGEGTEVLAELPLAPLQTATSTLKQEEDYDNRGEIDSRLTGRRS
jgi:two-component system sensor histidine kinase UhpB